MNFQKTLDSPIFFEREKSFITAEARLLQTEKQLQGKSAALNEVLGHLEEQKKNFQDQVVDNIQKLILPNLQKLKKHATKIERKYLELIEANLETMIDSFGKTLRVRFSNLTAKEVEICNMIRTGFSTKQIQETLKVSVSTIETHRSRIRKKLGICNQKINLTSYLKTL